MDLLILLGCFHFCWFEFGCSRDLPGMRGWGGVWWGWVGCGGVVIHSRLVYIDFAYGLYNICISICI